VFVGSLVELDPEDIDLVSDMTVSFLDSWDIVVVALVVDQGPLDKSLYLENWKPWVSVHQTQDKVVGEHLGKALLGSLKFADIPAPYFEEAYLDNFVECLVAYYLPYCYLDMEPYLVESLVEDTQEAGKDQVAGHKDLVGYSNLASLD